MSIYIYRHMLNVLMYTRALVTTCIMLYIQPFDSSFVYIYLYIYIYTALCIYIHMHCIRQGSDGLQRIYVEQH